MLIVCQCVGAMIGGCFVVVRGVWWPLVVATAVSYDNMTYACRRGLECVTVVGG